MTCTPLALAEAMRRHHGDVFDLRVPSEPAPDDIAAARAAARDAGLVVVATLATNVQPSQAKLVEAVLETATPTVTVAMRTPYDLADYPASATHLCSYSIVPASVNAVADALDGGVDEVGAGPVGLGP